MESFGPCVIMRNRKDGTVKFRFEVRRNCPSEWPRSIPILPAGRDFIRRGQITPEIRREVEIISEDLYRKLLRARASEVSQTSESVSTIPRSWSDLIALRRQHSAWHALKDASRRTYMSTQNQIIELLGKDPSLAPSVVLESQVDRILLRSIDSAHKRKKIYREVTTLLDKAVREGWRAAGLTIRYKGRLPKPTMRTWTASDLQQAVSRSIVEGERGLARLLLTQWEIGQRLQSVRNFRYGYQYVDGAFHYRCVKNEKRIIRISVKNPKVRRMLDEEYRHGEYMFPRSYDMKPFIGTDLSKLFIRIRRHLKEFDPKLQLRHLRHTVVLDLALAGCTIPEIASITGHEMATVYRTLEHYLGAHPELAEQAVQKREKRRLADVNGVTGELIVEGARVIFLGDLPKAETPKPPVASPIRFSAGMAGSLGRAMIHS